MSLQLLSEALTNDGFVASIVNESVICVEREDGKSARRGFEVEFPKIPKASEVEFWKERIKAVWDDTDSAIAAGA